MTANRTVFLWRSGKVWVTQSTSLYIRGEQPLITETVQADTDVEALGKVLLKYVDKANQPSTLLPPACSQPCCQVPCVCGLLLNQHTHTMSPPHMYTPIENWEEWSTHG